MVKMKHLSFLLTILFLISSCNSEDVLNTDSQTDIKAELAEQARSRILSMGLDTTDMVEIDNYYVVENDILINKDSLFSIPMTRQYRATNTVATGQTITISISSTDLFSAWIDVVKEVANIYSSNTGLYFKFIGYGNSADIVISRDAMSNPYTCAEGEFPVGTSGKPGKNVRINSLFYKDIDTFLSEKEKIFLMMHEIGHNLGLRHTDCVVKEESANNVGMVKIPGTPDTDSDSYMNSRTCGHSWNGMSKYDAVALNYLFPVLYNTIHFENCTGVSDIKYKKGSEYQLSRTVFPQKEGYAFSGWCYGLGNPYIPEVDYNKAITNNVTLYAKWRDEGENVLVNCTTYSGEKTRTFNLKSTSVVTFTRQFDKALNTWSDLRAHDGTFSKLERIDGDSEFSMIIDMRTVEEAAFTNNPSSLKYSETFVLESGTYMITSSLTTELGVQDVAMGKHGSVATTISYYE